MDKNTQQPVAWCELTQSGKISYFDGKPTIMVGDVGNDCHQTPLFTYPPVPRDVLMAFGDAVWSHGRHACRMPDIAAIADRYASKVQPEPVNQQLLAALKRLLHKAYKQNWQDNYPSEVECAESAIAAAESAQPVGVCQAVSVTDERAAFEAWAKENCCAAGGINFKRFDVGGGDEIYDDPSVETSYQAYLAGARQQPASTQPTDEAVAWMTQGTDGPIFYTVKPVNGLERFTPLYPASAKPVTLEPVEGDQLPAIGEEVLIHLASSDKWIPHRVVGYYAWGDLGGNKNLHRVSVRVVGRDGCPNARLLSEVRRVGEETAQQPVSAQPMAVPDGYVLVPIDPTSKMCRAGTRAWSQDQQWLTAPVSIYSAMLSAAPKPEGHQ